MKIIKTIFILLYLIFCTYTSAQPIHQSRKGLSLLSKTNDGPDFSVIFKYDYPEALKLLKENECLFRNTCSAYQVDPALAISIVFPEFIRYSDYKNVLEVFSLEAVYVNLGKDCIDFSVGPMQMKPSFAEKLENFAQSSAKCSDKYKLITTYKSKDEKSKRIERLERLKSADWQIIYLCLFCDVVSQRFKHVAFNSDEDIIRFYAAAYNSDFLASKDKIISQIKNRYFPDGKYTLMPQYAYSEVAVHFYRNYYHILKQGID